MADALDPNHLFGHVQDAQYFEVPHAISPDGKLSIPQLPDEATPETVSLQVGFEPIDNLLEPLDYRLTKFMVLEVVAAVLLCVIFIWLARKISGGGRPKGKLWNTFEAMLIFLRDDVARPSIGRHDADRFLPFVWTIFFFVLACNLLGMVPWAGSPTGALGATGMLALITLFTVVGAGMQKLGPVGFWKAQVPHMDVPLLLAIPLVPMIFAIEVLGLLIRHFVLAMRLLANMMAGHLVLAVLIAFIGATWHSVAWWGVMPMSLLGATALSCLELFVAFLQAYIFAFLSSLFIGMAVHPH